MDRINVIMVLRLVIAALGTALGVFLLVDGRLVIGGLILAITVTRITLLIVMWRRRHRFRPRLGLGDITRPG